MSATEATAASAQRRIRPLSTCFTGRWRAGKDSARSRWAVNKRCIGAVAETQYEPTLSGLIRHETNLV